MDNIIINKKQMAKLVEIGQHFTDVEYFKLILDTSSGNVIAVTFNLFESTDSDLADRNGDTTIDISDVCER